MIEVVRREGEDASKVAADAARAAGTKVMGNLRWYGAARRAYRGVATADGQGVRVNEEENN